MDPRLPDMQGEAVGSAEFCALPASVSEAEAASSPTATSRLQLSFREDLALPDNMRGSSQPLVFRKIVAYEESRPPDQVRGRVIMPTGSGKTIIFAELMKAKLDKTVIVVPTTYLLKQTAERLRERHFKGSIGFARGIYRDTGRYDAMIATYRGFLSYAQRSGADWGLVPHYYGRVVLDDGHHATAPGTRAVLKSEYGHAKQLGFTATEQYNANDEDKQLRSLLPDEIHKMTVLEAAQEGLMAPFSVILLLTGGEMRGVRKSGAEYHAGRLDRALNTMRRNRLIAYVYKTYFSEHKAIFNVYTTAQAEAMALAIREQGLAAAAIYSRLPTKRKRALEKAFNRGDLRAVSQVKMLSEGFDDPTVSLCVNVMPTLSLVKGPQRSGRPLRIDTANSHKYAVVLECIDQGYREVPVLYMDPRAGGSYAAGWEHATPTALVNFSDLKERLARAADDGIHFVTDPATLQAVAAEPGLLKDLSHFAQIDHDSMPELFDDNSPIISGLELTNIRTTKAVETALEIMQLEESDATDSIRMAASIDSSLTDFITKRTEELRFRGSVDTVRRVLVALAGSPILKDEEVLERYLLLQAEVTKSRQT